MFQYTPLHRFQLITGHFGSGKTNVAVNLALHLRRQQKKVMIADLDIVNPYFRMADNTAQLEAAGIRCIVPEFANSNVDIPSIPPEINRVFEQQDATVIFDIGGDDSGAVALGMFASRIAAAGYDMLYVVNQYRPLTQTAEDALHIMREIECSSRLHCTGIVNNSNLGADTDAHTLPLSRMYGKKLAELSNLPVLFETTCTEIEPDILPVFHMEHVTKQIYGGTL